MIRMPEPDYIHYTRLETIYANEAQWLLAVFELRDKEFSDKDKYEAQFNEQLKLAGRVLSNAFKKHLKPIFDDPDAISFDDFGVIEGYVFSLTSINVVSFCSWALGLNYNLPDVLVKLAKGSDCNIVSEEQGDQIAEDPQKLDESQKIGEAPVTEEVPAEEPPETEAALEEVETPETGETQADDDEKENQGTAPANTAPQSNSKSNGNDNGGGRPEDSLAEAVRYAYNELLKNKDEVWRTKKGNIRNFIEFLKFMATEGNPHADKYVMVRIESVKFPHSGDCTIKTQVRSDLIVRSKGRGLSKSYHNRHVTKILMRLRKEPPHTE